MIVDGSDRSVALAAEVLRAGGLVGLPTETVYGLAADATNSAAVARVFAAKGRPTGHPLIVHLRAGADLGEWAQEVPDGAYRLAASFWPGPLTLVLDRHPSVIDEVTGGLGTVALRVPAHPVAQRVLQSFGGALGAPSANRFGRVSPTTARDVEADLGDAVDLVVDGGPCEIGVESTIVAFVEGEATIVRPGGASPGEIARALGKAVRIATGGPVIAPGMLPSHYAPATPVEVCEPEELEARAAGLVSAGRRVGVLSLCRTEVPGAAAVWDAGGDMGALAGTLYSRLRQADAEALGVLLVALPPDDGLGTAVRDRLRRAAHRA
ncbi:MAG: L-threonylcarbamoyladenylate synthase [Acidimicrobiales bacterium]